MREDLLRLLQVSAPQWDASRPGILSLAYYPLRVAVAEWMLYALLMGRYVKFYEYTFETARERMSQVEQHVLELHRWRRRSKQSLHKLQITTGFVEHWRSRETQQPNEAWDLLLADLRHVSSQIDQHAALLEALNPIITSLVQLMDSRRSLAEAVDVKRLTYIALVFIPMSLIAAIFSMANEYGPGSDRFWVYWATSVPATFLILVLSFATSQIIREHSVRMSQGVEA
jgi:Mg2+ and Co2+ transporter CorA